MLIHRVEITTEALDYIFERLLLDLKHQTMYGWKHLNTFNQENIERRLRYFIKELEAA